MNEKTLYPLYIGQVAARMMEDMLSKSCRRIEVAGSVRRGRPQVHDVDLVIWPKCEKLPNPQPSLFSSDLPPIFYPKKLFDLARQGGWGDWGPGDWPGIIREPDGSNFEALLQMRTGSAEYNIRLARRAQDLGLRYKAGYGIFDGERRVDDGTERGIWTALGWEWVPPESRG